MRLPRATDHALRAKLSTVAHSVGAYIQRVCRTMAATSTDNLSGCTSPNSQALLLGKALDELPLAA